MSSASELKRCPKCGGPIPAEAPQGLCPQCLLLQASLPTEAGAGPSTKSPPPTLKELAVAFPQLEILGLIGQGGMGFVFKTRQPKLERLVALKILPQSLAADPAFAERFTREGRALARLNHPNIVTIHDFGEANGFFYLLMEYVDGVNLRQAMKVGKFTPDQALAIVPKICDALQFAHNEGILHRDIKPENILLDAKGRVKIADFGIAKITGAESGRIQDGSQQPSDIPNATGIIGTPQYMAPEQIEHPKQADQRADVYSLGVVFYEMLTGELPLGRFAPPSEKSTADPRLDEVVMRALEKEPERRTQSAGEMKTQVETFAGRASIPPFLDENKTVTGTSAGYSFRGIAPFFRRGLRVGLFTFLTFVALVAVSSLLLPKTYMATARVDVSAGANATYDPYRMEREINTIKTPDFCLQIVSLLDLAQRWSLKSGGAVTEEVAVEWLKMSLQLSTSRDTGLLEISYSDELPTEAAEIANRIAESYCALPPGNRGRIIDRAYLPSKAIRPNIPLNIGVGMAVGLVVGFFAFAAATLFYFWKGTKNSSRKDLNRESAIGLGISLRSSALNAVAFLFVSYGLLFFWIFTKYMGPDVFAVDLLLFGIPIGIGLLRRRPRCRLAALVFIVISLVNLYGYTRNSPLWAFYSYTALKKPHFGFLLVPALFGASLIFAYFILCRRNIKERFRVTEISHPWIEWAALGLVFMFLLRLSLSSQTKVPGIAAALPEVQLAPAIKQLNPKTDPFVAHLTQGTIELVAVGTGDSHYPSTNLFDWWKPDGRPIERLRYEYSSGGNYSSGDGDSIYRQLVFRTSGLPPGSSYLNLEEVEPARSFEPIGTVSLEGKLQPNIRLEALEFPPNSKSSRIKVSVASQAWIKSPPIVEGFQPRGRAFTSFEHDGIHWSLRLLDIEGLNDTTQIVAYHTAMKGWQSELVIVDLDGKEWTPSGPSETSEGLNHLSSSWNLPLSKIKEAYLRIRPYQWVEFRNVSLIPEQHTDVTIVQPRPGPWTAEPVPESSEEIAKQLTKKLTITKIVEENHRIAAWTESGFQAGETVAAVIRLPDGSLEDAMTQIMTIRGNSGRRVSTAFSWQLPDASDARTRSATRLQAQKNSALGSSIVLGAGNPFFLFAETNNAGGRTEAFLEFRPTGQAVAQAGPPQASVHFGTVTNLNQMVLGYFDPVVPAGNFLESVAIISGRAEAETHTSIAHSARYNAGDCRFDFPPEFTAKEMQTAVDQIEELKKKGLILIPGNKRLSLFSVTNNAGATYEGFLELRAPYPGIEKGSRTSLLINDSSVTTGVDEAAQVKLKFAEGKVKEAEKRLAVGAIDPLSVEKAFAARDIIIAEMKGDAVEAARIKLRIAESEYSVAERRRANGVDKPEEYENAKLARDLALISLRKLEKAKGP